MKPYALYVMLGFAIILDFLSLFMIVIANGPGFVIGTLGFLNSAVFISTHTVAFLAHIATQEGEIEKATQKEQNPLIKQQMNKAKTKLVESIKRAFVEMKLQQLAFAALAAIVSSIPVLGSFIFAHTIAAFSVIMKHHKLDKIVQGWTGEIQKTMKSVKQVGRSFGGGNPSTMPASRYE